MGVTMPICPGECAVIYSSPVVIRRLPLLTENLPLYVSYSTRRSIRPLDHLLVNAGAGTAEALTPIGRAITSIFHITLPGGGDGGGFSGGGLVLLDLGEK